MTKTTCPRCGHKWHYKGQAYTITCPSCRKMFKNPEKPMLDKLMDGAE